MTPQVRSNKSSRNLKRRLQQRITQNRLKAFRTNAPELKADASQPSALRHFQVRQRSIELMSLKVNSMSAKMIAEKRYQIASGHHKFRSIDHKNCSIENSQQGSIINDTQHVNSARMPNLNMTQSLHSIQSFNQFSRFMAE